MTLSDIRALLVTADPNIRHYFSMSKADGYTYWEETRRLGTVGDNGYLEEDQGWRFYVHRFTKSENDPVVAALSTVLNADPRTAFIHTVDPDPESDYVHHIFECEGY